MPKKSGYSKDLALRICQELAEGRSLRSICIPDDMPAASTVCLWLTEHKDFAEQYTRAREAQADALVEEILEIADDGTNDWIERLGEDGKPAGYVINGEHVQRSRLRVDARKWFASKVAPKKYGEKLELAGDKDNPLQIIHAVSSELGTKLDRLAKSEADRKAKG